MFTGHSHTQVPMHKYGYSSGTGIFALKYIIQDTDTDLKPLRKLQGVKVFVYLWLVTIQSNTNFSWLLMTEYGKRGLRWVEFARKSINQPPPLPSQPKT